jgi:N-acetylglucosaminyl-diphospho-decaprenol L-rhamnosyltransferase
MANGSAPVTVAVISWNTRALLQRCLRSLAAYAQDGVADVWVVDNASNDGSAEMVRDEFPWVQLVAPGHNAGFGPAVNLVAERTSSPWLVLANADTAPRPGAIEALLDAAAADPGAGVLAPRLVLPDGCTQHSVFAFPTVLFTFMFNAGLFHLSRRLSDRLAIAGKWDSTRARRVPWAVGAFLLLRREAWDDVHGFDPRQWMYAEDLDLGWRMRTAGWATRYEPRAVVDHHSAAATTQMWGPDPRPRWQRSTYGWMMRRFGPARTRAIALMNLIGTAARYVALAPAARLAPERWAEHRRALVPWIRSHLAGLGRRSSVERYR